MRSAFLNLALILCGASAASGQAGRADFNVTDYGAKGDGATLATEAIQKAVDACAQAGGGRVLLPAGRYLSGPIFLRSNLEFHIGAGATLLGSTDFSHYPPIEGRWEGIERKVHASLLTGLDLENLSVTGRGTIDGQGQAWRDAFMKTREARKKAGITEREPDDPPGAPLQLPRPRLINLYRCKNVLLTGIKLVDSPSWTIHPVYCEDLTIDGLSLLMAPDAVNADGINPDSCKNVRIANCYLSTGDDCITIKSGYNADGRRVGKPCENITVTNCTFARGHGGVVIGSEMSGDVRNVVISNCVFDGTDEGIRIKSARGRGGIVENIRATNLVMRNVGIAFSLNMYYQSGGGRKTTAPVDEGTPTFREIHYSDVTIVDAGKVAVFEGLPERALEHVSLSNVVVVTAKTGIVCSSARNVAFRNVTVNAAEGPALRCRDVGDLDIREFTTRKPLTGTPVIQLENVVDTVVSGCRAPEGTGTFLEIRGEKSRGVALADNLFRKAASGVTSLTTTGISLSPAFCAARQRRSPAMIW